MPKIDLQTASAEEIAEALLGLEKARPGLAYDVGQILRERGASKEFPGPDPWADPVSITVLAVGYDPSRINDVVSGFRIIMDNHIPTYDEKDPQWQNRTKAERRAAKREVEAWANNPDLDRSRKFIATLDTYKRDSRDHNAYPLSRWDMLTREQALTLAARWEEFGVKTKILNLDKPTTHRRYLDPHWTARA